MKKLAIYLGPIVAAFVLLVTGASAAGLSNISLEVQSPYTGNITAGEIATYVFGFDVATEIPSGGHIDISFPSNYGMRVENGVTCNLYGPNEMVEGFISVNPDNSLAATVHIPQGESVMPSPTGYYGALNTCWIEVINPITVGQTGGYDIYAYDSVGNLLDYEAGISGSVVVPADTSSEVSITIASPAPGDEITAGTQDYPILINRTGTRQIEHIAIYQSVDGGVTWIPLENMEAQQAVFSAAGYQDAQQMYAWDVPDTVNSNVRLKAIAYGVQYGVSVAEYEMTGNVSLIAASAQDEGNLIPGVPVYSLIKASGPAVYYYAADGRRYVFPSESVFYSWYENFDSVITITDQEMSDIPMGNKRITMRSGTWLIKTPSVPTVYAVSQGTRRPIVDEAEAELLYGPNWNQKIVDISPVFFGDYKLATDLGSVHPWGTVLEWNGQKYMAGGDGGGYGSWFLISDDELAAMRIQDAHVVPISYDPGYVLAASPVDEDYLNTYRHWNPELAY